MNELQSNDYVIPSFLLLAQPQKETGASNHPMDDFMKYIQGWTEILPMDELE